MATIVADVGGGNWTTGATWVGGIAPTAADDAQLIVTSGNVTIDTGAVCRGLDCTGYTGTLTHTAGVTLTIGDGTAAFGNTALVLVSGMTYTLGSGTTSVLSFVSTSATLQTIAFGGKTTGNITLAATNIAFVSAITTSNSATLTHTSGTLHWDGATDNSGLTHNIGNVSSDNSNTRTTSMGTATILVNGSSGTIWNYATVTGLTVSANTATITMGNTTVTLNAGSANWGDATFRLTGVGVAIVTGSGPTFKNLLRSGTAVKTDVLSIGTTVTVTGTFTVNGNSSINRVLVQSSLLGSARQITAATVTITNADFRDITGAGAGSWNLSAITGLSGDCGGNSGITFTTAATQTYTGGADNWSTAAKWTSRVPLPQDDVLMSGVTGGTITSDMPRIGKSINWTGASGSPSWAQSGTITNYGSITLISAMTLSAVVVWEGRGSFTLTNAGKTWATSQTMQMVGGTMTLQDAMINTGVSGLILSNGTFNANNFNVTANIFNISGALTRTLTMGSGTWTSTGTGTVWSNAVTTNLTFNANTSTISFTDTSASAKTFTGGGLTYYNFKIAGGGAGTVTITGANTFNRIYMDGLGTKSIVLPGSTTTTLLSGDRLQNGTNVITFTASAGSATVSKSSGYVDWNYVNLTNIISTGGATFYAGANSTDGGGNTGWIFTNPVGKSNMLSFF